MVIVLLPLWILTNQLSILIWCIIILTCVRYVDKENVKSMLEKVWDLKDAWTSLTPCVYFTLSEEASCW